MTMQNRSIPLAVTAALAGVAALLAGTANAAFVNNDNGDGTQAPYFVSQAYVGTTYEGGPDNSFAVDNGIYYTSNAGPLPRTAVNTTFNYNGATVTADAWSVSNGFYSARNYASMTIDNAQASDGYYAVAGFGTRTSVQFFTPEAAAARSVFTWRVTGTESEPFGRADARMDFLAGSYADAQFIDVYSTGQTNYGPGTYSYNLNAALNDPIDLFFWSSAFVQVDRGVAPQGSDFTITANYGSTYELVGIDLFDEFDNELTNWWMVDLVSGETVFTEDGRTDAANPSVPEPGSLALLGMSLAGMAFARRRRTTL